MVAVFYQFLLIRPQRQQGGPPEPDRAACSGRRGRDSGRHDRHPPVDRGYPRRRDRPGHGVGSQGGGHRSSQKDEEFAASEIEGAANLVRHKWLLVAPICSYSGHAYRAPRHPRDRAPSSPFYQSPKLGLDARAAYEIVLRAVPPKGTNSPKTTWTTPVEIMRSRVDKLGVSEPEIRQQEDQISLQLRISDPQKAADLVGKTAQLWLFDLQKNILKPLRRARGSAALLPGADGQPVPAAELEFSRRPSRGRRRSTSSIRRRRR